MSSSEVQITLPARAENVALVRQAVAGIGDAIAVDPALLADIKTAVTEACNNVVVHAYRDMDGAMEVEATPEDEHITITVRDWGDGLQPHAPHPDDPAPGGLGLPLIGALSDKFEIHGGGLGIEVRMVFLLAEGAELPELPNGSVSASAPEPPTEDSFRSAGVAIAPGRMMAPVLGRLTGMLAARSDFSLDRLSNAVLVCDAISENVSRYLDGHYAEVAFQDGSRKIDMRFGPLVEGGADELVRGLELPGLEHSLKELADEVKIEKDLPQMDAEAGPREYLLVRLSSEGD